MFKFVTKKISGQTLLLMFDRKINHLRTEKKNLEEKFEIYVNNTKIFNSHQKFIYNFEKEHEDFIKKILETIEICENILETLEEKNEYEINFEEYHFAKSPAQLIR
jgi:hypothetical protein